MTEAVVALLVFGLMVAVATPHLATARHEAALASLDRTLRALAFRCRSTAILNGTYTALVFEQQEDRSWVIYTAQDGDGDGVLQADLDAGTDRVISAPLRLEAGAASPGILTGGAIPDPSGHGILSGNLEDPIRCGRGDKLSFSPGGTATPGSVYLTDHRTRMRVLRVYGGTARPRSLRWARGWSCWRSDGT